MKEVATGVYDFTERKGGNVHAFLLDTGADLMVIDTLFDTNARQLLRAIKRLKRPVSDLRHIVLTHGHRSHLGGLAALKRQSGAAVYAHAWETDIIAGEREAQRTPLRPLPPYQACLLQLGCGLGFGKHPPCPVDRCVKDGDTIGPLQVIQTPGHTPGSLAFYWPDRRVLFTGDVVVSWPSVMPGWPSFTLNARQQRDSIGRLSEFRDAAMLAVGHGNPIADGAERLRGFLRTMGR
jgi:glyoxylase-like metal-dependent hydrolase (beta-lactamase superfamily II)